MPTASSTPSEVTGLTSINKIKDDHTINPFDLKFDQIIANALESFSYCWTFTSWLRTCRYTAAAVSLLVDDYEDPRSKHITWTTPMRDLIPEDFVLNSEYATAHLTIEDYLSHRSGLPSHRACLGNRSVKESTRNLRHLSMNKEPRTTWQYSNHTYCAISHMIEVVSGKGQETFMTERLWKPLEMNATFLSLRQAQHYVDRNEDRCLAKPYSWNPENKSYDLLPYWDDEGISGSGAMVSNISDQAKWIRSFINQNGTLSKAGYEAVTTPHMLCFSTSPRFMDPDCHGLGWFISRYHGEKLLYHPVGVVGFTATMIYLPKRKWGVVGMCNGSSFEALDVSIWHLVDELLKIPLEKRIVVFAGATQAKSGMRDYIEGTKARIFPSIPNPPIPLSLSITEYVGSYSHIAYGIITIFPHDGEELRGRFQGRKSLDLDPIILEHVSGEFFFAKAEISTIMSLKMRVRFEIDAGSLPARLGLEFSMDDVIWFLRD